MAGKFQRERNIWKKWPGNSRGKETSGKRLEKNVIAVDEDGWISEDKGVSV